ncbi:MAG: metal-dependent hydrolase, partial [Acidimicrobiales bacterium]
MMARDHAALAAMAALGFGRLVGLTGPDLLAATAVATGAALLPDIDEPGSTVAHLMEPVTGLVAWMTKRIAGGHRVGTHSLLAVALAGLGTWALGFVTLDYSGVPASVVPLGLCLTLAIRGLIPSP